MDAESRLASLIFVSENFSPSKNSVMCPLYMNYNAKRLRNRSFEVFFLSAFQSENEEAFFCSGS